MSINVNCSDLVEVKYLDDKDQQKVEVFLGNSDSAKDFIRNPTEKHFSVLSVTYFIQLMISDSDSSVTRQPAKRFAEHEFNAEEFLTLSPDWIERTRNGASQEIDSYMLEHYKITLEP